MTQSFRFVLALLVLLVGTRPGFADDPAPPAKPDGLDAVRRGLAARAAAFQNIAFRLVTHDRSRKNLLQGGPFTAKVQTVDALIDTSKGGVDPRPGGGLVSSPTRADVISSRDEEDGPVPDPVTGEPVMWSQFSVVVTPEESRMLGRSLDGKKRLGNVQKLSLLYVSLHPLELLDLCRYSPAVYLSQANGMRAELEGAETVRGVETLRVSWVNEELKARGKWWVAPGMGYAVCRCTRERRPNEAAPWREILVKESDGFTEVDDVWVPGKVSYVRHAYYNDGAYELEQELEATFERWSVNQTLAADAFTLKFPKGTIVRDHTHGDVTYVKGAIDDPSIGRDVAKAKALAAGGPGAGLKERYEDAARNDPFASRADRARVLWSAAGITLVTALGLSAWFFARGRRRRTEPNP